MLRSVTAPHRLLLSFTASLAASLLACLSASAEPPLILEAAIPLENVDGRIDHMAIDLARKRLLVAELGNGTVDVVDLVEARAIHRISGLKQPQGAAYIPQLDLVGVSSAHDGSVSFFQGEDYAAAGVISLGEDADNIRVDPTNGQLIVGYGSGGLAVIDSAARRKIRDVPLPGHPEGFQIDPASARVFVNVPDARQIAVVDGRSAKPLSAWHQKDLKANFPLALDAAGKTVASVFRSPPKLLLFDADTGSVMASVETCRDADDVFFDNGRERIYVSCGAGAVDVFQRDAEARRSGRISTAAGARTSLFVPELDRLFVAEPAGSIGATAKLLVYRPVT